MSALTKVAVGIGAFVAVDALAIITGTGHVLVAAILGLALLRADWIPTIIAGQRGIPNAGSVAVINLFLGWTFIGWVVALAKAVSGATHRQQ
jgi:hypothetical protein